MVKSSFGPHRGETSWAAVQTPRTKQRIVRLGPAANDNFRPTGLRTWLFVVIAGATGALLGLIFSNWRFF